MISKKKTIKTLIVLVIILSVLSLLPASTTEERVEEKPKIVFDPFLNLELEAKAVYVFDIVKQEVIFEMNENYRLPLASLTKVMTALVAKEFLPNTTLITITKEAIKKEGDDKLLVGEKWKLSSLVDFMILKSSNDGAAAIAMSVNDILLNGDENGFIKKMNEIAKNIGMEQSYFFNETGLDLSESVAGAYGSAEDMAKLMIYALKNHPSIMEATQYSQLNLSSLIKEYTVLNSNNIAASSTGIIASKTGFTDLAGGNLAIIFDVGYMRPMAAVVLGSTYDGRFSDIQKIISATLKKLADEN